MSMHPSVRKGAITDPASVPFINYPDSVFIQDDHFLPDYSQDIPLQYFHHEQPRLQSPFEYHPDFNFLSPPSSAPSSPTASPASSITHIPATAAVAAEYPAVFDGSSFEAPSMTPAPSYNPSIHIEHSASPLSQSYLPPQYQQQQQFVFDNSPMLTQHSVPNNHGWESNLQLLSPGRIQHNLSRTPRQYNSQDSHLQTPSTSSGRSSGNSFHHRSTNSSALSKPLPTPVQTPVQNSFLTPQYQKNDQASLSSHDSAQQGRIVPDQQQSQSQHQHHPSDYSLAPSVSSVSQNSPVTPHTGFEEVDDSKAIANDYGNSNANNLPLAVPKLNRTITDIYQDELYNPAMVQSPQVPKQQNTNTHQQSLLSPAYRNVFADRLQAANQGHLSARAQSPVGSINRERSPFRQNSPLAAEFENESFQQQPAVTSVPTGQTGVNIQHAQTEPKTMSPKDAVLNDFNEGDDQALQDHGLPLFAQPDFNFGDALGLRQENSFQPAQNFPTMESFPPQFSQAPQFSFNQPSQSRRPSQQQHNHLLHHTPEFPASLSHFDSTGSEVLPSNEMTSPSAQPRTIHPVQREITRPQDTSADGGTYTCTYHGCTQRFETPAKLQKHKREAHRQTTPGGHLIGRDGSSRNSQAGPHKCERINPSTGKPCNSIFSRPYDLTRHEDTIHNARKQKVRCHLCTEEKTFSRNDALTRHMRVVHPDVDWPGKQRRRGRE